MFSASMEKDVEDIYQREVVQRGIFKTKAPCFNS